MKIFQSSRRLLVLVFACALCFLFGFVVRKDNPGYYIEHENQIKTDEAGPHSGGGKTVAFSFFDKVKGEKITFRKRVLFPGSAIGYHLQEKQEIYYILDSTGELTMNGKKISVTTGDAILTMPGSSHGLRPAGDNNLTVLIVYENN